MTEVWMYSVPVVTAAGSFFFYLLTTLIWNFIDNPDYKATFLPLVFLTGGTAMLLMLASIYELHMISTNTTNPDLTTGTRATYIITLTSTGATMLYVIIMSAYQWVQKFIKTW